MLTIPLATLLGLAENPGDAPGWGALDPALARQMAAAAARNPRSTWCVTVTDEQGHAIGHGCAQAARRKRKPSRASPQASRDGPGLTFTPTATPDAGGGYGTWHLKTGGREYAVKLHPIPVTDCDHRYESAGYRPSALLATWSRYGTASAPSPPADAPPGAVTSSMRCRTTRADGRVAATAAAAAAATTGSSNHPAGPSPSSGPVTTSGPPRRAAPSPASPCATRSEATGLRTRDKSLVIAKSMYIVDLGK